MILGKYFKSNYERKRYSINYDDWLDDGEMLTDIWFDVFPVDADPVVIDGIAIQAAGRSVIFYASAGLEGKAYKAICGVTTSGGQNKEDSIHWQVKAP